MADIVEYSKKIGYDYVNSTNEQRAVIENLYNKDKAKLGKKPNQWLSFTREATAQLKNEKQKEKITLKDIQIKAHELAAAAGYQYKYKNNQSKELIIQ
jgi:hypothetical protein